MIDEANIQTTIVVMRKAVMLTGKVPKSLELVAHDPVLFREAERRRAIAWLEKAEREKQKKDTLHVGPL